MAVPADSSANQNCCEPTASLKQGGHCFLTLSDSTGFAPTFVQSEWFCVLPETIYGLSDLIYKLPEGVFNALVSIYRSPKPIYGLPKAICKPPVSIWRQSCPVMGQPEWKDAGKGGAFPATEGLFVGPAFGAG